MPAQETNGLLSERRPTRIRTAERDCICTIHCSIGTSKEIQIPKEQKLGQYRRHTWFIEREYSPERYNYNLPLRYYTCLLSVCFADSLSVFYCNYLLRASTHMCDLKSRYNMQNIALHIMNMQLLHIVHRPVVTRQL